MKGKRVTAVLAVALATVAGAANGAIIEIGQFSGEEFESFETQPRFQFLPSYDVFDDDIVRQLGAGQGLHITTGWSFFGLVNPHHGEVFMGGAGVNAEWEFTTPALKFGGYFTTNADVPDAVARIFDEDDNLLATLDVTAPLNGQWTWNGWETTGAGIKRVQIIANNSFNGFIMHDSMEYTEIPEPGSLALFALGALALIRRR